MIYRSILRPILFQLSPETAHELALNCLSVSLGARSMRHLIASRYQTSSEPQRFGLEFANPVGLAAGFDKNGRAADALAALGLGLSKSAPSPTNRRAETKSRDCFDSPRITRSSIALGLIIAAPELVANITDTGRLRAGREHRQIT